MSEKTSLHDQEIYKHYGDKQNNGLRCYIKGEGHLQKTDRSNLKIFEKKSELVVRAT